MPITTIRPTADEGVGAWLDDGGAATLWAHVADNNDSTFIIGTVGYPSYGYHCHLLAGDISALTATQRVMRVRVRVRYAKSTGAGTPDQYAAVSLFDSHTRKRHAWQSIRGTTFSLSDITFPWWTNSMLSTEPSWGQTPATTTTLINRLGFVLKANNNYANAAVFLRIFELYADVDIHTQVTISGLGVTGHTTSARPTVSWTYNTNADLDQQRSFQVKIFTQAQTAAAGFSAAGSDPVWDSGAVRSTATSVVSGISLVNGVTYTAYVRASSEFNGTDWWTDFSATSNFTMAYVAPPAPTLTVTPETTAPSLRNLLAVDTKLNLLTSDDSTFEAGLGTWAGTGNATVVQSSTQAADGTFSMRMTVISTGDMFAGTQTGIFAYPVNPGVTYTALVSTRAATTVRSTRAKLQWINNQGTAMTDSNGSPATNTTSGFTQVFVTAVAPAGAALVRVLVEVTGGTTGEQHYVDKASLHTGSSTTWTAGGLQKSDSAGFTRLDRTRIEFLDWNMPTSDTTNIINPNIASGGEAYGDPNHGFFRRSTKDLILLDQSGLARQGEKCIRWVVGETSGSVLDIGTPTGSYSWTEVPTATLPGVPGRTYTFSFYVRSVSGAHDLALAIVSIDQAGAVVGSTTVGSTVAVGTAWSRLTVTHTMAAASAGMRGELRNLNGDLAEYLLDQFQLEEGSVATAWRRPTFLITGWQPVRGALTALQASERDGMARIYDREAPPGVIRMYRAWTEVDAGQGEFVRSAFTAYVPAQVNPLGNMVWILKDPQQAAWDLQVHIEQISGTIDEDFVEAHPNRPNDRQPYGKRPVIVSDWISGKNGQATIVLLSNEDWFSLQALLHTNRALLLQFPEGGQRYVRFESRSWNRDKPWVQGIHQIVVDFAEVARPVVTA